MSGLTVEIDSGNDRFFTEFDGIPRRGDYIDSEKGVVLEVMRVVWFEGGRYPGLECEEVHETQEGSSPEGQERPDADGDTGPGERAAGPSPRGQIMEAGELHDNPGDSPPERDLSHRCDTQEPVAELRGDEGGVEAGLSGCYPGTDIPRRRDADRDDRGGQGPTPAADRAADDAAASSESPDPDPPECPRCKSTKVNLMGVRYKVNQWRCVECGMTWGE